MVSVLRPGQRVLQIPAIGVQTSRRAVSGGNGLLNNLVAYWPLNEAAGANNALDLHTNGLTLTQTASPGSAAGKVYAGARTFNGSTQYFSRASEALLQTGDVDFTVATWVFLSNTTHLADIVNHYRVTPDLKRAWLMRYEFSVSRFNVYVSSDGTYTNGVTATELRANSFGAASAATWYLFNFWHDSVANTINVQINNGTVDSKEWTAGIYVSPAAFGIGKYENSDAYLNGRIGPVAMWKSAAGGGGCLTAAQRTALYNSGAGLTYASFTV